MSAPAQRQWSSLGQSGGIATAITTGRVTRIHGGTAASSRVTSARQRRRVTFPLAALRARAASLPPAAPYRAIRTRERAHAPVEPRGEIIAGDSASPPSAAMGGRGEVRR